MSYYHGPCFCVFLCVLFWQCLGDDCARSTCCRNMMYALVGSLLYVLLSKEFHHKVAPHVLNAYAELQGQKDCFYWFCLQTSCVLKRLCHLDKNNFLCAEKIPRSAIWGIFISRHKVVLHISLSKSGKKRKAKLIGSFLQTALCKSAKFGFSVDLSMHLHYT